MKKNIFDRRIPTVFALIILLLGLAVTSILIQRGVFTTSKADPFQEPKNIQIINVTNNSFAIVFTTFNPVIAAVKLTGPNIAGGVTFDDRNNSSNTPFMSHLITIKNLKPKTTYEFTILSNGTTYLNNGKGFTATTAQKYTTIDTGNQIHGSILLPDGKEGSDTLVLITPENGATTGIITNEKGEYDLSTDLLRSSNYEDPFSLNSEVMLKITASQGQLASQINSPYSPGLILPPVTLSNNYSFIESINETPTGTPSSLLTVPQNSKKNEIKITVPLQNQTFTDSKPQFKGLAFPGKLVKIAVNTASPISAQVRSDPNGNWTYRPQVAIAPGLYSISIDTTNELGISQRVSSSFQIFASGSQIAESATPSATPSLALGASPTPIPTLTSTPTPTSGLTPSPTLGASPTTTLAPTFTPAPTIIPTSVSVVPTKVLPPTGSATNALILTTISILFIVSGSVLLFIL